MMEQKWAPLVPHPPKETPHSANEEREIWQMQIKK